MLWELTPKYLSFPFRGIMILGQLMFKTLRSLTLTGPLIISKILGPPTTGSRRKKLMCFRNTDTIPKWCPSTRKEKWLESTCRLATISTGGCSTTDKTLVTSSNGLRVSSCKLSKTRVSRWSSPTSQHSTAFINLASGTRLWWNGSSISCASKPLGTLTMKTFTSLNRSKIHGRSGGASSQALALLGTPETHHSQLQISTLNSWCQQTCTLTSWTWRLLTLTQTLLRFGSTSMTGNLSMAWQTWVHLACLNSLKTCMKTSSLLLNTNGTGAGKLQTLGLLLKLATRGTSAKALLKLSSKGIVWVNLILILNMAVALTGSTTSLENTSVFLNEFCK